jgi:hypothetical protein
MAALGIPGDAALVGAPFHVQSWHIDWLANPGLATVSNAAVALVGAR